MQKEYGGYLPLELNEGKDFFSNELQTRKYNSGRAAIYMALEDLSVKRCWVPNYLCEYVKIFIASMGVEVLLYNISEKFEPLNINYQRGDAVLYTNYFGLISDKYIEYLTEQYEYVILDNTQAFFRDPLLKKGVYNVYSCRKFFGVNDGAYLISKAFLQNERCLCKSHSEDSFSFLAEAFEKGTNAAYEHSLENEKRIDAEGVRKMSNLTDAIMKTINYDDIEKKRKENFDVLNSHLVGINELSWLIENRQSASMVYPFLVRNDGLRSFLIENKIYVPQWWKYVLNMDISNDFECLLSKYLIALPIDQRYTAQDMEHISSIVLGFLDIKL